MISIRPRSLVLAAVSLLAYLAVASGGAASDWPQWRGPLRNGIQPDGPPLARQRAEEAVGERDDSLG